MKLFVYGTLKKGYGNHNLLKEAKFIAPAATVELYQMFGRGVPVIYPLRVMKLKNYQDERLLSTFKRVKGELYSVDVETMKRCDILEGHPTGYTRKVIDVVNLVDGTSSPAFIYEMLRPWGTDMFSPVNKENQYEFAG